MNENKPTVISTEEYRNQSRDDMMELLTEAFDNKSILYEIYKNRGWLDRLFTDEIQSMNKDTHYSTSQVAKIVGISEQNVKNKRRELLDYINPVQLGEGTKKTYKHNYISVFKIKMIDGLTGLGSDYTIPQIKELIYGGGRRQETTTLNTGNDLLLSMQRQIDDLNNKLENNIKLITSEKYTQEIVRLASEAAVRQLPQPDTEEESKVQKEILKISERINSKNTSIEEKQKLLESFIDLEAEYPSQTFFIHSQKNVLSGNVEMYKEEVVKEEILKHYEQIASKDTSIEEKEKLLETFSELEQKYPTQAFTITMYKNALQEKINTYRQDKKELEMKKMQERCAELFYKIKDETLSKEEREQAYDSLVKFEEDHKELSIDIRMQIANVQAEWRNNKKKKRFLGLF